MKNVFIPLKIANKGMEISIFSIFEHSIYHHCLGRVKPKKGQEE